MILQILYALFSPDFQRVLIEIWDQQKSFQKESENVRLDQAFEQSQKEKNTESLQNEIGKLIK